MSLIKLDLLIIDAFVIVEDEMVSDVFASAKGFVLHVRSE